MIKVIVYSREDCHLCEQAIADLNQLQEVISHQLQIVDIDQDIELQREYGFNVPVVEIGPYKLKAPITYQELEVTLRAADDRNQQIETIEQSLESGSVAWGEKWTKADRFSLWLSRHWLALLNWFVILYLGLPILAPVFEKAGMHAPAQGIYRAYSLLCHQFSFRSFFLFGEQFYYPRESAGVDGVLTLTQATGLDEGNSAEALYQARKFVGNQDVGFKIALCERDVAIYGGILLFAFLFIFTGRRLSALPWYIWILIAIVPMGLDGFSQLISQPPLSFIPFRESTPLLRVLTGGLFGFGTAWFGYPMVEETMVESRRLMERKWRRIHQGSVKI